MTLIIKNSANQTIMSNENNELAEIGIDTGVGLASAGVGLAIAGPIGALLGPAVGPVLSDLLKRAITKREKDKITIVAKLAIESINEQISKGAKPRKQSKDKVRKAKELFEGILLKARDTFEEKKLPFIANIFSVAPFTNTPVENLINVLVLAERLTYRQLCIIGVVGNSGYQSSPKLSQIEFKKQYADRTHDEFRDGVYFDIVMMINQGILVQMESDFNHIAGMVVIANIIPDRLRLYGLGRLLFNAMKLDALDKSDTEKIIKILS